MVGFRTRPEARRLQLNKIPNMRVRPHLRARTKARERADDGARANFTGFKMAKGTDYRATAHHNAGAENDVRGNAHIGLKDCVSRQEHGFWCCHRDTRIQCAVTEPALHRCFRLRQLRTGVDAAQFTFWRFHCHHVHAIGPGERDQIRQVILTVGIGVIHGHEPAAHIGGGGAQHAGIAQANVAFGRRGIPPFDDAVNDAVAGDHAAVASRVCRTHGQQRQPGIPRGSAVAQCTQRVGPDEGIVGIEHRHFTIAKERGGLERGVGRAQTIMLDDNLMRGGRRCDRLHIRPNHHHDSIKNRLAARQ